MSPDPADSPARPSAGAGRRRRLALVAGSGLLLALLGEVAVRVYDGVRGVSPHSHNFAYFLFRPHPYRGYSLAPGLRIRFAHGRTIGVNSLGFRGPEFTPEKPPGTTRIFCLGESSTFGLYESDEDVWPRRLEERLRARFPDRRFEVVNAGVPGYSSYESLIYLQQEIVNYRPDAVLAYHGWNDAIKLGTIGASGNLPETGILRVRHVEKHGWLRDLLNGSSLFGVLENRVLDPLWVARHEGRWFFDRLYDERNVETDLAAFERNLRAIARFAGDNGFEAVLCAPIVRRGDPAAEPKWARWIPRCEETVRKVARETGAALADAARGVEAKPEYLLDPVHFTPRGSEAMAEFLAARLAEILPKAAR
ncbi:MAG TPA: GDSL-type esterase/lipase family protein [Planctomycetota bacterium]|jgi:lysophospholipase L1-like esterase|nr:GDSL-type esterase/lipase family protein [Planctomycetota bacterium]